MGAREWQQEHFDRLAALTAADFDSMVGEDLPLADEGGRTLAVVAVERSGRGDAVDPSGGGERHVDVVLGAAIDVELPQGMHAIECPGSGIVPVSLVPAGPTDAGNRYVASFG